MSTQSNLQIVTSEMNVLFVHSAVDDYPLSTEEFRVYAHLARRAGSGEAWPSIASIAKHCRIHEDTARRCVHSITAYGLIDVTERGHQGKSNLYRLTPVSKWKSAQEVLTLQKAQAEAGKTKRAAKKAASKPPSEMKGGVVNEGRGSEWRDPSETKGGEGGETKGGHPSETKGDEVNPAKGIQVRQSNEREAPAAPALADPSGDDQKGQGATAHPADAGAADAADVTPQMPSEGQHQASPDVRPGNTTDHKKIPGGAARAAGGAGEMTAAEAFLRRKLSDTFIDRLFDELQPLGVERRVDWPALSLERVQELMQEAQRTHTEYGVKVPTRLRDLLDDECRRVSVPLAAAPAAGEDDPNIDPLDALLAGAPLKGQRSRR